MPSCKFLLGSNHFKGVRVDARPARRMVNKERARVQVFVTKHCMQWLLAELFLGLHFSSFGKGCLGTM